MNEIWKKIKVTHELVYDFEVSESGNIRKVIDGEFKPYFPGINSRGYKHIGLYTKEDGRKFFTIHRIVALAFLDLQDNKNIINHKDGDRLNNHYTNLEWVTHSENLQHSKSITHNKRVKDLSDDEVKMIIADYLISNMIFSDLRQKWNISRESLRTIINSRSKKLLSEDEYNTLRNKHFDVKKQKIVSNKLLKNLDN